MMNLLSPTTTLLAVRAIMLDVVCEIYCRYTTGAEFALDRVPVRERRGESFNVLH